MLHCCDRAKLAWLLSSCVSLSSPPRLQAPLNPWPAMMGRASCKDEQKSFPVMVSRCQVSVVIHLPGAVTVSAGEG